MAERNFQRKLKADGCQQAKLLAAERIRLLVTEGESKQCGTGSRSHGGQMSSSLATNVRWTDS